MDPWDPAADSWQPPATPRLPRLPGIRAASWRLAVGAAAATISHYLLTSVMASPVLGFSYGERPRSWIWWADFSFASIEVLAAVVVAASLPLAAPWSIRAGRALGWIFTVQSIIYVIGVMTWTFPYFIVLWVPLFGFQALLVCWSVGVIRALRHIDTRRETQTAATQAVA